ncbi:MULTISPECIES: SRPBCC family protein [unclassified Aureimonas]|uniref:SRPBCC family protein n=1 Tax=unclassified Aureimonas TaxID=2615206 RepID=UPI00070155FE|nr:MULTISPECIES: SRPBCC family protein [unclassified Aureimonas]KQT53006.1 hypothetical protein ASG62_13960 [Aureimonas sp. Leaf427]KQT80463.1 hypothetical protein ASG54_07810 [Aureimonas sp. Leaf460]
MPQVSTSLGELGVTKSATTDASPGKVWSAIGDFAGIAKWHPAIQSATIEERDGQTLRLLVLNDGATVLEALVDWDDAGRSYTYRILDGAMPVDGYISTLSVTADGDGSRIEWTSTFDAKGVSRDEATGVISAVYESGLAGIVDAVSA